MIRLRHKLFIQTFRLFDISMFMVVIFGLLVVHSDGVDPNRISEVFRAAYQPVDALAVTLLIGGWVLILNATVRYDSNRFVDLWPQIVGVAKATTAAAAVLFVVGVVFRVGRFNQWVVLWFWLFTSCLAIGVRIMIFGLLRQLRRSGKNYRYLVLLAHHEELAKMAAQIDGRPELGYKIVGLISTESASDNAPAPESPHPFFGTLDCLPQVLKNGVVDEVLLGLSGKHQFAAAFDAILLGQQLGVVVRIIPNKEAIEVITRAHLEVFEGRNVVTFFREIQLWHLLAKRAMDLVISAVLLLVFSPVLLIVGILVRATSPGPALFVQERVGINKRLFRMYKFRSMYLDADSKIAELAHLNEMQGPVFKMRNDPRITPLGRFLRQSSIDELPQLWNVLKGEMSLVGPRPPMPREVEKYVWLEHRRLSIKPGITCLWQISGRSNLTFDQWMELDRKYIDTWTIWLDISILFRTIPAVLFRKGAA